MKLCCSLAAAAAILMTSPAYANDGGEGRFAVTAGYASHKLGGDDLVPYKPAITFPVLSEVERDRDDSSLSLGLSWFVNKNIALELWTAGKFDGSVELDVEQAPDVGIARYQVQPLALSAQYHITQFSDRYKPFVGLGYHRTKVSGVSGNPDFPEVAGLRIEDGSGLAATAGLDVALTSRWFVRGDVRYLRWNSKSHAGGQVLADADVNSLIYGVNIGLRF
jgi:outer membrane protein